MTCFGVMRYWYLATGTSSSTASFSTGPGPGRRRCGARPTARTGPRRRGRSARPGAPALPAGPRRTRRAAWYALGGTRGRSPVLRRRGGGLAGTRCRHEGGPPGQEGFSFRGAPAKTLAPPAGEGAVLLSRATGTGRRPAGEQRRGTPPRGRPPFPQKEAYT